MGEGDTWKNEIIEAKNRKDERTVYRLRENICKPQSHKVLVSKYVKNSQNPTVNPVGKWAKDMNGHFT